MAGYRDKRWARRYEKMWSNKRNNIWKDVILAMLIVGGIVLVLLRSFGVFDQKYDKYVVWVTTNDGMKTWTIQEVEVPEGSTVKVSQFTNDWLVMEKDGYDEGIMSVSDGGILIKDVDEGWCKVLNICTTDIKIDGFAKVRD